jgi:hypothetical protein
MTGVDEIVSWSSAGALVGEAAVAAVASYEHAYTLARAHGDFRFSQGPVPHSLGGVGKNLGVGRTLSAGAGGRCRAVPCMRALHIGE